MTTPTTIDQKDAKSISEVFFDGDSSKNFGQKWEENKEYYIYSVRFHEDETDNRLVTFTVKDAEGRPYTVYSSSSVVMKQALELISMHAAGKFEFPIRAMLVSKKSRAGFWYKMLV